MAKTKAQITGDITLELAADMGMFLVGSAETVRQQIEDHWKEMRMGHLLSMLQFGTLPADLTNKNMDLFATEVMPHVRALSAEQEDTHMPGSVAAE